VLAGASELRQRTLRLWAVPESELAATLRRVAAELAGLEITTCQRGGELEIVSRYAATAEDAQQALLAAVRADFPAQLFSEGATIDELVAVALKERQWTAAVAEAATGGALCARLAGVPLLGGLVVHTDPGLTTVTGVPADVIAGHGPVSPQVAQAMAEGARTAFGADVGIAVSVLGLDAEGLGTVHLSVVTPDGEYARSLAGTGTADQVRERTTPVALHLLRRALGPLNR
jgi:nicotinamide-nucleotide amidase